MMERLFSLSEYKATIPREILAGVTTFLTMSYILVVQPSVLSTDFAGNPTGMEPGAILLATCLSSALATGLMGLYGKLPIALAPGMGQNFFFVSIIMALGANVEGPTWQAALGIVFVAGLVFLLLTAVGLRAAVLKVMSPSMRSAIAVGIGIFIAFIGLRNANVVTAPTLVELNAESLVSVDAAIFWGVLITTLLLQVRRVPGSILIGIFIATIAAWLTGKVAIDQVIGFPQFEQSTILKFDVRAAFTLVGLTYVAVLLFMDIFDTTGTLVAVSQQAGLMKDNELPQMRQAMVSDAVGTVFGACVGTSTVTSFIESATGVEQGGRTGLTAVTVAVLFLGAIAFSPLIIALGGYAPITAPALVVVGAMMFRSVRSIDWSDETESIPAFLTILGIPLFFSIADGIALGLIVWPLLKIAKGRYNDVPWQAWVLTVMLVAYFLLIRVSI
jgi:AGZA family xanthine/uracil permease-like MFS transporter